MQVAQIENIMRYKVWIDPPFTFLGAYLVLAEHSSFRTISLGVLFFVGIFLRVYLYKDGVFGVGARKVPQWQKVYSKAMFVWIFGVFLLLVVYQGILPHIPLAIWMGTWVSVFRQYLNNRAQGWAIYRFVKRKWPISFRVEADPRALL